MELKELLLYRTQLLDDCRDTDGYISDAGFIDYCLPWLNDTKHIDSTDVTDIYDLVENGAIKINAYLYNESGERLQLFLVNEDSLNPGALEEQLMVTQKSFYEKQMSRVLNFFKKSVKKQINELLQDASPAWVLTHQLSTPTFLEQIDVVEIFLLSATATVETRGASPSGKMIEFDEESISVSYTINNQKRTKDILIIKRLIDLNFLYNVHIASDGRYPLIIDFTIPPFHPIAYLHAASEADFDSYLCALPATLLADLYKKYSSRLLEKNVRSFLQLKGVNKGMQDTIRNEPEKFIAYNNGLTITATSNEITEYKGVRCIKTLSDFQIVNGGQTTATIYFSQKGGLSINSIQVMAKINVAKNASEEVLDDLISKISTFSNAQSKVSKVDLRARSAQLIKLKSLSESVLTISGKKWFFERAKGEYATMIRINSAKKNQLEKTYPKERRFTKEELAKYYSAWGDKPYAVKKGGEKIFRLFLEEISGEGKSKKIISINRNFYEDLIARIILFRSLEKIYGAGGNSLGQLRSAVVPYSISALYEFTTGNKNSFNFDLLKIWKTEKLDEELQKIFKDLMILMNKLIKNYSKSDDLGEYSKKPELWEDIESSIELKDFMNDPSHQGILKRYSVSPEELKKREKEIQDTKLLNFEPLLDAASIFDRGTAFYRSIIDQSNYELKESEKFKLNEIISAIHQQKMIEPSHIAFEKVLIRKLASEYPDLLSNSYHSEMVRNTVNFVIKKYNSAISAENSILAVFDVVKEIAKKKGVMYYSVWGEIGRSLKSNEMPSMQHVLQASEYLAVTNNNDII